MDTKEILLSCFPKNLRTLLEKLSNDFFNHIQEIRIRASKPIIIVHKNKEVTISERIDSNIENGYCITAYDIKNMIELMSDYSLYSVRNEIANGYLTLRGGHRVGLSGTVAVEEGSVKAVNYINSLNIRVAHEIKNCSSKIINLIASPFPKNTIIISPPGCGKTTLLRDIVRNISNGVNGQKGKTVGLIDERSEISAMYMGIPQNDIGLRTDVLDGCPKSVGVFMMLRSMSPKVIAIDELGKDEEISVIEEIINSGVKLICTAHGSSIDEIKNKGSLAKMISNKFFEIYVILQDGLVHGEIGGVYDKEFNKLF